MIPKVALALAPAGEMDANPSGMEDTRKWSSGVGLWGKRSEPIVDDQPFLAFIDAQQNGRYMHKRPEDTWNKLNSLWGKRSSNWQTATGLWGKRSPTGPIPTE